MELPVFLLMLSSVKFLQLLVTWFSMCTLFWLGICHLLTSLGAPQCFPDTQYETLENAASLWHYDYWLVRPWLDLSPICLFSQQNCNEFHPPMDIVLHIIVTLWFYQVLSEMHSVPTCESTVDFFSFLQTDHLVLFSFLPWTSYLSKHLPSLLFQDSL